MAKRERPGAAPRRAARADEAPTAAGRLGDVLAFMSALWALDHALRAASKQMLARLGMTSLQRLVIRILGASPG